MSTWDSADLLSRCKVLAERPAVDQAMTDNMWYSLLTEAQAHYFNLFSVHFPWVLMGAPVTLTSADGGLTFTFPNGIYPLAIELFDTTTPARLLRPGAYWDSTCDYVWEGNKIRFPQGQTNPLATQPVARFITPPDVIDASTAPTLQPPHTRLLLVYHAVAEWASRGGKRDPAPFFALEQRAWMGNPALGDVGILGAIKLQNPWIGGMALTTGTVGPLSDVDTGAGYVRYPP